MTAGSERSRVRRVSERAAYERATIDAILDEALVCHVAFTDDGLPVVIPTLHARVEDHVYLHGSVAGRLMRTLAAGAPVAVAVTLIDGLVLARSAFHHSMNYRSVVLFGTAEAIEDRQPKLAAMKALTEKLIPGRWDSIRPPSDAEFRQTLMVRIPIDEASAKIRNGPPGDDEADLERGVWAGVVPLSLRAGPAEPDPGLPDAIEIPAHIRRLVERFC